MTKGFLFIALFSAQVAQAQLSIKGTVSSAENTPLTGATVRLKNTFTGTSSNLDGAYLINNLKPGLYVLECSFIGFKTQTDTIELNDVSIEKNFTLSTNTVLTDEFVVLGTRANAITPMTFSNLDEKAIAANNVGVDLPILLDQSPSAVTTSDAGAGVGYTGMRIRGSDQTRINVTVNGIPLNDAESQGVFWVNMPDFASSANSIQIQRGVGSSTNGGSAFGATVNLQTNELKEIAYTEIGTSVGSFNTMRNNVKFGTGLINKHFTFDGRLTQQKSDGYIDRASSDLKSYYMSAAYYSKNASIRFVTFSGKEQTYQAWGGVPADLIETNRTYNPYTYENEIDNYQQTHYQLLNSFQLSSNLNLNVNFHYTKGAGYYEQFKTVSSLDYGIEPLYTNTTIIDYIDIIRRLWLDNDFYGTTFNLNYDNKKHLQSSLGGGWNMYIGDHYGKLVWASYAGNTNYNQNFYDNTGQKADFNVYWKTQFQASKNLNTYIDVQYRKVDYLFFGYDNQFRNVNQTAHYNFFNPKAGLSCRINDKMISYASVAVGNKEPNRDDFVASTPTSRPKHETLYDYEAGLKYSSKKIKLNSNLYYMDYRNQLVLSGKINDVGAYTRTNVDRSYRTGIELDGQMAILNNVTLAANATFSRNIIKSYNHYVDNSAINMSTLEYEYFQETRLYTNTPIAFSPNVIAGGTLAYLPFKSQNNAWMKHIEVAFIAKYVSEQHLDNTGLKFPYDTYSKRTLDSYLVNDIRVSWSIENKIARNIEVVAMVRNTFNKLYSSNGYTYGYVFDGIEYNYDFYYPQAGTNFFVSLNIGL